MLVLLIVIGVIVYYLSGIAGWIFWWTKTDNVTTEEIGLCLFCGLFGPFTWFLGWRIHGTPSRKVLIPQRVPGQRVPRRTRKAQKEDHGS